MVGMVQLVSAPDCGSGYHGFESHYPPFSILFIGLSPSGKAQDFDSCIRWFESNWPSFSDGARLARTEEIKRLCGCGGTGRRARLRIWCLRRAGSSPVIRIFNFSFNAEAKAAVL